MKVRCWPYHSKSKLFLMALPNWDGKKVFARTVATYQLSGALLIYFFPDKVTVSGIAAAIGIVT